MQREERLRPVAFKVNMLFSDENGVFGYPLIIPTENSVETTAPLPAILSKQILVNEVMID